MANRRNAGWTTQDCPGSQAMVARPGDPMGFCVHCRKPVLTNGMGRIRRHTVPVRIDEDPRGRRRASLDLTDPYLHDDGGDDGTGEGWGTPEDLAAVAEHVRATPPGASPWGIEGEDTMPRAAGKGFRHA